MSNGNEFLPQPGHVQWQPVAEQAQELVVENANRAWSDLEPKIERGLLSGTFATALVGFLSSAGIELPAIIAAALGTLFFFVGGYLKSSNARGWKL